MPRFLWEAILHHSGSVIKSGAVCVVFYCCILFPTKCIIVASDIVCNLENKSFSDSLTCTSALYVTADGNGMWLTICQQLWVFIPCDCMFQFSWKISYNKNNYYKKLDHWIMQFKTFYWLSRYGIFNNYSMSARWI